MRNHSDGWMPMWSMGPLLKPEDCKEILEIATMPQQQWHSAVRIRPDGTEVVDTEFRNCDNLDFHMGHLVYNKVLNAILEKMPTLEQQFNFNLHKTRERFLPAVFINRYIGNEENPGHLEWHMDTASTPQAIERKLSFSILLNDPSEWTGGDLEFSLGQINRPLKNAQAGDGVIFPSFVYHRVKPVTSGVRYSIVAWLRGPRFR